MVNDPIKKGLSEVDLKTFYQRTLCFGFPTSLLSIHMSNNVLTETAFITVTTNFIRFFLSIGHHNAICFDSPDKSRPLCLSIVIAFLKIKFRVLASNFDRSISCSSSSHGSNVNFLFIIHQLSFQLSCITKRSKFKFCPNKFFF